MRIPQFLFVGSLFAFTTNAIAQDVLWVTDIAATGVNEGIFRLADSNADGDMNDPGEVVKFYDDVAGGIQLSTNQGVCVGANGTIYVSDSAERIILSLHDNNADGDANDPGEAVVFFDGATVPLYGGNAGGVVMTSANGMWFEAATGKLWVATANTASGVDEVIVLQDLNMDGDANDLGEEVSWWTAPAAGTGVYSPQAVVEDSAGRVYFAEEGTIGKGVYLLTDLNMDGDAQDPGERVPFFVLPTVSPVQQIFCLDIDAQDYFYMADFQYDIVYRFKDLNNDGDAMDPGESVSWYLPMTPSTIWDIAVSPSGIVYVSEGTPNVREFALFDADNDGVIGAGEFTAVYTSSLAATVITAGRGIAVVGPSSTAFTSFCFGDGSDTTCPCTNPGLAGQGCDNSALTGGAKLQSTGVASITADTLVLKGSLGIPFGPGLYYQGSSTFNPTSPFGTQFGHGVQCMGGITPRLEIVNPNDSLGASQTVGVIHNEGGITLPGTYNYQWWYRDGTVVGTCSAPASAFNFSSAITLTWIP